MAVKLLTYDVYRSGMTLFKDLADQTYQDKEHLPEYFLRKVAQAEVPAGYDSAYRLIYRVSGDPDEHVNGDTIGIMGSQGGGIIQTYIVGSTPLDSDWLSDVPGGPPIYPAVEFIYLVLTPGNMMNSLFRYNQSTGKYVQVSEGKGDGAVFSYIVLGETPLSSTWLSEENGGAPLTPKGDLMYLVMSPGKYQNKLYRYDTTNTTYVPVSGSGSGVVFAYEVSGKTPLASDWLTDEVGGSSITPDPELLYLDVTVGDYENYIFRYNSSLTQYVPISGGGGGNGAIYTYIVGNTAFSPTWLSDSVGGDPITPEEGPLYLVLTPGQHYSAFYRFDATANVYVLVGNTRNVELTKAEYLNLPTVKQNDGTIYFITDSATSAPNKDDYIPARVTVPENPLTGTVMLWKGDVTATFDISPAFYKYNGSTWVRDNLGIDGQTIQVETFPTASATLVGHVLQYIGATNQDYTHNYFYECVSNGTSYLWENVNVQSGSDIQVEILPTASAENLGKVLQYVGSNTQNYLHNFFYECVLDGSNYKWVNTKVQYGDEFQVTSFPIASAENAGKVLQYIGTTDANYIHNFFYECIQKDGSYQWVNAKVQYGDEFQVTVMPEASVEYENKVLQYIGVQTATYKTGYFYKCVNEDDSYSWENINVQDGTVITVDSDLSDVSENPVQNKVITKALETKQDSEFVGTHLDWAALSDAEKEKFKIVNFIDDAFQSKLYEPFGVVPVGTVISVMGNVPPQNYLACDGEIYNILDYEDLADYFEVQFGEKNHFGGDGITTFAVPNLQGEFLRGTGTNSHENQGSGGEVGEHQDGTEHLNVWTYYGSIYYGNNSETSAIPADDQGSVGRKADNVVRSGPYYSGGSVGGRTTADTTLSFTSRPTNTSVLYCIAYKDIYITLNDERPIQAVQDRWLRFDPLNKKGLVILAGTTILKQDKTYKTFKIDEHIDLTEFITASDNGKDFFVYLNNDDSVTATVTKNGTGTYIGRFHTLCADAGANLTMIAPDSPSSGKTVGQSFLVKSYNADDDPDFYLFYNKKITEVSAGTPYDVITCEHPLKGYSAGDILPESVFCKTFYPECLYEDAMVYDKDTDFAIDIYLQSGTSQNTRSEYGAVNTENRNPWNLQEDFRAVGKKLLVDHQFTSAALGSNERTNIAGSADVNVVGGHSDTLNRRMISAIGCEEMCGYLWQWLDEIAPTGGSSWQDVDGRSSFGQNYGTPYVLRAGGAWDVGARCGSRCRSAADGRSYLGAGYGGRGCTKIIRSANAPKNSLVTKQVNYSTSEQIIGTWIDGKPIYQKTVSLDYRTCDVADANYMHTWYLSTLNIDNVETPVKVDIIYKDSGNGYLKAGNSISSNSMAYSVFALLINNQRLSVMIGNDIVSRITTLYVTLQYTKTTD